MWSHSRRLYNILKISDIRLGRECLCETCELTPTWSVCTCERLRVRAGVWRTLWRICHSCFSTCMYDSARPPSGWSSCSGVPNSTQMGTVAFSKALLVLSRYMDSNEQYPPVSCVCKLLRMFECSAPGLQTQTPTPFQAVVQAGRLLGEPPPAAAAWMQ
jgi:hypothetical protein